MASNVNPSWARPAVTSMSMEVVQYDEPISQSTLCSRGALEELISILTLNIDEYE